MILENKGKEFSLRYDGRELTIPEGKFDVGSEIGNHIISATRGWEGVNVVVLSAAPDVQITPQGPTPAAPAPEVVSEPEAPVETVPEETVESPEDDSPVEDYEE